MRDCRKCRDFRDCPGKDYYQVSEIKFCSNQVIWLITHLGMLKVGNYPPDPRGTGYTDPGILVRRGKPRAYYETPCLLAAEVEWRLDQAGQDGKQLVEEILEQEVFKDFSWRAKRALAYISGFNRKHYRDGTIKSYQEFIQKKGVVHSRYNSRQTSKLVERRERQWQ